jgi:hypothetical protein
VVVCHGWLREFSKGLWVRLRARDARPYQRFYDSGFI